MPSVELSRVRPRAAMHGPDHGVITPDGWAPRIGMRMGLPGARKTLISIRPFLAFLSAPRSASQSAGFQEGERPSSRIAARHSFSIAPAPAKLDSLLPSCSTGRPVWPRRGLTRKSRFSNYMNARATYRSSHDRPLKNYLRRERKVTGVYSKIDSDLRLLSSIRPLHFHPGRLARNSYEPLRARTADLGCSRLIRSACSSRSRVRAAMICAL